MNFKAITTNILTISVIFFTLECAAQKAKDRVVPQLKDGQYSIEVQNVILDVDPALGARITAFKMDGKNFLTDKTVDRSNWGSTLWPSPQLVWNWPPSPELDNKPYSAKVENNVLTMVSQKDPKYGWVVTKEFSGNKKAGSFTLKFTISNGLDKTQSVAPWEVTRVHIKGLTFFPIGGDNKKGGLIPLMLEKDGINWFQYDQDKLNFRGDHQIYRDGAEGWLAQINDGVILVKKWKDVPLEKNAPGNAAHPEGEVELYTSGVSPTGSGYVEVEHQGEYVELKPGASTTWEVTWFLRKLPDNIKAEAGNPALSAYARKLVK